MSVRDFRARVLLYPSARLEIKPSQADTPIFESLEQLYSLTRWRGYYGGIRILQALIVRLIDYCREQGFELENRNFTLEYESTIPLRLGMGGSSAIITAALRALCQYFDLNIALPIQAKLILETETKEIGVPAGPQDRVIQVYEGLMYMDFQRELMESRGYGEYERLDPELLPPVYVAFRTSLSEGTEVFHNNVRERWRAGDPQIVLAMHTWAEYARLGRDALLRGDHDEFGRLVNANFDLRSENYRIDEGNLEMISIARSTGATANFAGSGGAIAGTYRDDAMFEALRAALARVGVGVIKPSIANKSRVSAVETR
jgi:glucuronokinase